MTQGSRANPIRSGARGRKIFARGLPHFSKLLPSRKIVPLASGPVHRSCTRRSQPRLRRRRLRRCRWSRHHRRSQRGCQRSHGANVTPAAATTGAAVAGVGATAAADTAADTAADVNANPAAGATTRGAAVAGAVTPTAAARAASATRRPVAGAGGVRGASATSTSWRNVHPRWRRAFDHDRGMAAGRGQAAERAMRHCHEQCMGLQEQCNAGVGGPGGAGAGQHGTSGPGVLAQHSKIRSLC